MSILITGGAGFIGSHLVESLLEKNENIIVIDNFHDFYSEDIKIKNVLESVGKIGRLQEVLNEKEKVNVGGYLNLLEECKKHKITKFIQASSSSVYGNNKNVPFKESDVVDFAISPYAATKKSGEIQGHVYYKLYGINTLQFRFFTVYGPRQRPDLAIYKFVDKIYKNKPIDFYGSGDTFRDYTYVKDTVDGIIKGISYLRNNSNVYEVINLGKTDTISLKDMVQTIEEVLNKKATLNKKPMQLGDVNKTCADISKAKILLGYNPKTSFKNGIENFVSWYMGGK